MHFFKVMVNKLFAFVIKFLNLKTDKCSKRSLEYMHCEPVIMSPDKSQTFLKEWYSLKIKQFDKKQHNFINGPIK